MVVTLQQVQRGFINFIEKEIAAKANGIKKFTVYFFMPTATKAVADYTNKLKPLMPDMFEGDNIKLDTLYNVSKNAIQKSGQIEFAGIIFNETDVDKLYTYIKDTIVQ